MRLYAIISVLEFVKLLNTKVDSLKKVSFLPFLIFYSDFFCISSHIFIIFSENHRFSYLILMTTNGTFWTRKEKKHPKNGIFPQQNSLLKVTQLFSSQNSPNLGVFSFFFSTLNHEISLILYIMRSFPRGYSDQIRHPTRFDQIRPN